MKTLIFVLIISSFIQSSILPVNLVLIILICRSYIRADKSNLFLAFGFGLLDAHFNLTPLGLTSLIYLILTATTAYFSKSRLAGNSLLIVPLSLFFLWVNQIVPSIFIHQAIQLSPNILLEALLSLPILYSVKSWEERFIVQKEIKLKV